MLYIVEVGSAGDVGVVMSQMRSWLDHYRFQPENFRHLRKTRGSRFRLEFNTKTEAAAFANAFGGRVLRLEPPLIRIPPAYALLPAPLTRHLQSRPP